MRGDWDSWNDGWNDVFEIFLISFEVMKLIVQKCCSIVKEVCCWGEYLDIFCLIKMFILLRVICWYGDKVVLYGLYGVFVELCDFFV